MCCFCSSKPLPAEDDAVSGPSQSSRMGAPIAQPRSGKRVQTMFHPDGKCTPYSLIFEIQMFCTVYIVFDYADSLRLMLAHCVWRNLFTYCY